MRTPARSRASVTCACLLWGTTIVSAQSADALDYSKECKAVLNVSTITLSTKLIVSIAADPNKRSCRFFVAPPPPLSRRRSAEIWFNELPKQKYLDSKTVEVAVSDLLVAPIPDDDTPIIQEVKLRINKNSDLLTHCVGQLFEKESVDEKSADGTFRCTVPRAAEQLTVTVALGQEFYSSIILPRPA